MNRRFEMTADTLHTWLPRVLGPMLLLIVPAMWFPLRGAGLGGVALSTMVAMGVVLLALLVTTLLTPKALVLTADALVLERLAWPSLTLPYSSLTTVEAGPEVSLGRGGVLRLAGVGGWTWSGGLFHAKGTGRVRAWLRRLGPTLIVRRNHGLPLLLAVDDVNGLRTALSARLGAAH